MSVVVASPKPVDSPILPQTPGMPAPYTTGRDAADSIVCASPSTMASPRVSNSSRSTPELLPTRPSLSKSTLAEVTKALEVGYPLKASHMCALLAAYPSPSKETTMVHPSYFDLSPPSASFKVPHKPLPPNKVFLAPLQHCDSNHWSLVRIQREAAHKTVMVRHYDPIPSAQRLQGVERVMKLWAKLHHPGWDVRVSEVSGPRAPSSAHSGLYVVLGADEFPATCSFAPTWKPKSPQNAVVAALERYDRAASTDSGVSMDEDDPSKASSSGQSSKRSDSKKGGGIGTAKRSKGSLVRSSLSRFGKEKSPVATPKKASPSLSEKTLPPKPRVPGTPQSEQKPHLLDTPKIKPPSTPLTEQKPSLSSPKSTFPSSPQSEQKQQLSRESSKLNILTTISNSNSSTLPPKPSVKRPRSNSLSENPSGKKRCTTENRDTGETAQDIDAFLQGLSFPSPEQATADVEGGSTAMMAVKSKLRRAIDELKACDQEYAERFETYSQHKKDWKDLSEKITQDASSLEDWFNSMPAMNTMTPEQCDQFRKPFQENLNHHRDILEEKHERVQAANALLKSAEEVCDANKATVAKLEIEFSKKEAEYGEMVRREEMARLLSDFGDRLGAMKARWEN